MNPSFWHRNQCGGGLADFGGEAGLVATVPEDATGQACINHLRRHDLHLECCIRKPGRMGFFSPKTGAPQRPSLNETGDTMELDTAGGVLT